MSAIIAAHLYAYLGGQVNILETFGKTIAVFAVNSYLQSTYSDNQLLEYAKRVIDLVADGTIKPLTGALPSIDD